MGLYRNLASGNSCKIYRTTKPALFCLIRFKPFHLINVTDLNPSESRKNSSLLILLFSTLKRSNSRISLNEAIHCSLPTSATSRNGSLLKHLFFPLWTTFSTQTSLVLETNKGGSCVTFVCVKKDLKNGTVMT